MNDFLLLDYFLSLFYQTESSLKMGTYRSDCMKYRSQRYEYCTYFAASGFVDAGNLVCFCSRLAHIDVSCGEPLYRFDIPSGAHGWFLLTLSGWKHLRNALRRVPTGAFRSFLFTLRRNNPDTPWAASWNRYYDVLCDVRSQMLREDHHAIRHNLMPLLASGRLPADIVRSVLAPFLLELPLEHPSKKCAKILFFCLYCFCRLAHQTQSRNVDRTRRARENFRCFARTCLRPGRSDLLCRARAPGRVVRRTPASVRYAGRHATGAAVDAIGVATHARRRAKKVHSSGRLRANGVVSRLLFLPRIQSEF